MKPQLRHVGSAATPVVVIDDFSGALDRIIDAAAALAPFPKVSGHFYPGLRRVIGPADGEAFGYAKQLLSDVAPFIGGAYGLRSYSCQEASFSIVTAAPQALAIPQRMPHFDSTDPKMIAMLHYLSDTPGTGTGFFRQRGTGIETVSDANLRTFMNDAQRASPQLRGYIQSDNRFYEQIGFVEAVPDRLVIYPGSLLHSGMIPPDMELDADPRKGRLTSNFFLLGQ